MVQIVYMALVFGFTLVQISISKECRKRQGNFLPVEERASFSPRRVIATFNSPSELACSQKCFNYENCKYKNYKKETKTCELLESFKEGDAFGDEHLTRKKLIENENKQNTSCELASEQMCGERPNGPRFRARANRNTCDYRKRGVYKSCMAALSANNFQRAIYWVFPPSISNLMAVECMRDTSGTFLTIMHHDTEKATIVTGYEKGGSYKRNIRYDLTVESIASIINQSIVCKQHTNITCKHVAIKSHVWIDGRDGQKLNFLGGGPGNGTGCACGITNTCARAKDKCNCDINDHKWRIDEGYVTKKEVLPITAIYGGDTGSKKFTEMLVYTVGPLICDF